MDVQGRDVGADAPLFRYQPVCTCGWAGEFQWVQTCNQGLRDAMLDALGHAQATGHTIGALTGVYELEPFTTPDPDYPTDSYRGRS